MSSTFSSRVAWRRMDGLGVSFDGEPVPDSLPLPGDEAALKRRIWQLETEVARLQNRLRQLTEG